MTHALVIYQLHSYFVYPSCGHKPPKREYIVCFELSFASLHSIQMQTDLVCFIFVHFFPLLIVSKNYGILIH